MAGRLTYSIEDDDALTALVQEYHDRNGIYPEGETRVWETTEMVKNRVMRVLEKYTDYACVIISGHEMMIQAVSGFPAAIKYGQIVEMDLDRK